jgi:hypothetical protein
MLRTERGRSRSTTLKAGSASALRRVRVVGARIVAGAGVPRSSPDRVVGARIVAGARLVR